MSAAPAPRRVKLRDALARIGDDAEVAGRLGGEGNLDPRPRELARPDGDEGAALAARVRLGMTAKGRVPEDLVGYGVNVAMQVRDRQLRVVREYLEIGRLLLEAQERLREHYLTFEEAEGVLPFSKATASKLRTVARAHRDGVVEADDLPPYSIAYDLVRLPEPAMERAKREGLVRPDVSRREVTDFVRRSAALAARQDGVADAERRDRLLRGLRRRRALLLARADEIAARITALGG